MQSPNLSSDNIYGEAKILNYKRNRDKTEQNTTHMNDQAVISWTLWKINKVSVFNITWLAKSTHLGVKYRGLGFKKVIVKW